MIGLDEFIERVCALCASEGPRPVPRRRQDREILMKSIRMEIEPGRVYAEREIDQLLIVWKREVAPALQVDHVSVRRMLVDYGHLERTPDGSAYRLGYPARPLAFDLRVDELDLRAIVTAYREHLQRRREAQSER